MQQLGSRTTVIDGVEIYADHADPNQFWYLPSPVRIARRPEDDQAALTFIKYKPAAVDGGAKGGGFLMFQTELQLDPDLERRIRSRLSGRAPDGEVRLSAVPFDEGTVECIALDLQGGGGTEADAPEPGTFRAVERILGATVPSLAGANTAAFSLTLSQEGATILEQALEQGTQPVGVLYELSYSILRPALHVKIEADLEKIYNHFSASLEGQYYFFKAGIDAGFEKLKQEGVIDIEVIDFSSAEDRADKEQWALDFFKENILEDWFEPTLGTFEGVGDEDGGSALGDLADAARDAASGNGESDEEENGGGTATDEAEEGEVDEEDADEGDGEASRRPAQWEVTDTEPDPLPADHRVEHRPSETGDEETLVFHGGVVAPTVTVDDQPRDLDGRSLTLDVPAGETREVRAQWPEVERRVFELFFDYDEPEAISDSDADLAPDLLERYKQGTADDDRFNASSPPSGCGSGTGADALRDWLDRCVRSDAVSIFGHASYEGRDEAADHNMELSRRREEVALAIARDAGATIHRHSHMGHQRAAADGRVSSPDAPSPDRVVEISEVLDERPAVQIEGTLERPSGGGGDDGDEDGNGGDGGDDGGDGNGGGGGGGGPDSIAGEPAVSFKLRFVRQEERKHFKMVYNRTEAVKRTFAPQGFIGLLAEDLEDEEKHFVEVDLDDPFFRQFTVQVEAPFDFERIGLSSAHVSLDYGSPDDPDNHRHRDFVLEPDDRGPKRETFFMNGPADTSYEHTVQFHFSPDSGWQGEEFSYEIGPEETEDRTLLLNPARHLSFHEVKVIPGEIDFGIVRSLEVDLEHVSESGFRASRTFLITEDSPAEQSFKVRTPRDEPFRYTSAVRARLTDGTVRESEPVESDATILAANDPFEGALELDFVPAFDPEEIEKVFIDVEYEDPDNDYRRSERLEMSGDEPEEAGLRIALLDPDRRTFRYRLTFLRADHGMERTSFIEETDTLIAVTPDASAPVTPT